MQPDNLLNVDLCQPLHRISNLNRNKLSNTLLHTWPPKQLLQILIHLRCSRMNTQSTSMTFFKNPSLQLRQIRYTNSISESQNSKLIQSEIFSFALINQSHTTYKIHI